MQFCGILSIFPHLHSVSLLVCRQHHSESDEQLQMAMHHIICICIVPHACGWDEGKTGGVAADKQSANSISVLNSITIILLMLSCRQQCYMQQLGTACWQHHSCAIPCHGENIVISLVPTMHILLLMWLKCSQQCEDQRGRHVAVYTKSTSFRALYHLKLMAEMQAARGRAESDMHQPGNSPASKAGPGQPHGLPAQSSSASAAV